MGAIDSPDSTAGAHADGSERARKAFDVKCEWLQTGELISGEYPNSISACLDLREAAATPDLLESQKVVVLVRQTTTGVYGPYSPVRADRKYWKSSKWIGDLVEITS